MKAFWLGVAGAAALLAAFQMFPKVNPIPHLPVVWK